MKNKKLEKLEKRIKCALEAHSLIEEINWHLKQLKILENENHSKEGGSNCLWKSNKIKRNRLKSLAF